MAEKFILVLFTASAKQYANLILNQIFKKINKTIFTACLYRDSCTVLRPTPEFKQASKTRKTELFVKDLNQFGRDLDSVILVDNSSTSFALQIDNGVPISNFKGDPEDEELYALEEYLLQLSKFKDVRIGIREHFNFL
jgi:TFIIF-interacting CTD phosphatase-like protein